MVDLSLFHSGPATLAVLVATVAAVIIVGLLFGSKGGASSSTRNLPLPPGSLWPPFIGTTLQFLTAQPSARFGSAQHKRYGSIFKTYLLGRKTVVVADPQAARRLFAAEHDLVESQWPSSVIQILGTRSLITQQFHRHTWLRKAVQSAMSPAALATYVPKMESTAREACAQWAAAGRVRAQEEVKTYAFRLAMEVVCGFNINGADDLEPMKKSFYKLTAGLFSIPINLPGTAFHAGLQGRKELLAGIERCLHRKAGTPKGGAVPSTAFTNGVANGTPADGAPAANEGPGTAAPANGAAAGEAASGQKSAGASKVRGMMQLLEDVVDEDGRRLDLEQLKDNALSLLFAGHDTSASTLYVLLYCLARNPDQLQKLRDEQQQIVREYGEACSLAALKDMRYAEAAIKEALRLIPVVAGVFRRTLKDFELEGFRIPKGWDVLISLQNMLLHDERWQGKGADDPLSPAKFAPERWLTPEAAKPAAWMPFGSGARMCLGYPFAMAEIKTMLAVLARGYEWRLVNPDEEFGIFPMPTPKQGLLLDFSPLGQKPN